MPLTDDQKKKLKDMSEEDRAELIEVLGLKSTSTDPDILKTLEVLQSKVDAHEKALTRSPGQERRKKPEKKEGSGWFDIIFGGA